MKNKILSLLDHIEYVFIIPLVYRLVKKNYKLRCKLYDYIERRFPLVINDYSDRPLEIYEEDSTTTINYTINDI